MTKKQKLANINGSWLIAGGIAAGIALYLVTADVVDINDARQHAALPVQDNLQKRPIPIVHATCFEQTHINRTLTLYGTTQTDRTVTVSAELAARVIAIKAKRGQLVSRGQEIIRLHEGSLKAQLASAKARVRQADQDYQSALSLQENRHIAENQITQLEATLAEAIAQREQLQIQWDNTRITAPITGILNQRMVETGDYIDKAKPVAEILDLDPLVVRVDIPQTHISHFKTGQKASVRFASGETSLASIRFIDREASPATRTFGVELTIANPDMAISAGLSVEADLLMEQVQALAISPAWLALSEAGEPGIKWVNPDDQVQFTAVDVVKSESDRLWITGIPGEARIITRGQGFVRAGDQVDVHSPTPTPKG